MKIIAAGAFLLSAVAAACAAGGAIEEEHFVRVTVRIEVQMISLPSSELWTVVPAMEHEKSAKDMYGRLQKMLAEEKAELLGWPVVWAWSEPIDKNTAVVSPGGWSSESVQEFRFPTEFNPPQVPNIFGSPRPIRPTWDPATPTAWETVKLGGTLTVRAMVRNDGRIALRLTPEFAELTGLQRFLLDPSPLGIKPVMTQPGFRISKTTAMICTRQNQPALLGVFVLPGDRPRALLFIARAQSFPFPGEAAASLPPAIQP